MKTQESCFPSIIEQNMQINPEVIRAQRMAELEQMAKYRAQKLQHYKDWADPVKRAEIKAKYEQDVNMGLDIFKKDIEKQKEDYYEKIAVRKDFSPLKITLITKTPPMVFKTPSVKIPWYKRLFQ